MNMNNPWLALSTYEEKDEKRFYGREQDTDNLFYMLQQNDTVICYAASGDGKSSLINAGLCPKLRRDNMFPIRVLFTSDDYGRPNVDFDKIITERIIQSIRDYEREIDAKAKELGITRNGDFEFIANCGFESSSLNNRLWWKLRTQIIINPFNGNELVPVLVFDQFEEIFHAGWKSQFFHWLEAMLSDVCPDDIIQDFSEGADNLPTRKQFKMLFSMRYEYVGELDYWCSQRYFIPQMMRNRYYLKPLRTIDAIAIIDSNKGDGDASISNLLSSRAPLIVNRIKDNSRANNTTSDTDEVSAIALSLVCHVLYNRLESDPNFSLDDSDELEEIINSSIYDYYDDQLNALQMPSHLRDILEEVLSPNNDRPRIPVTFPKLRENGVDKYIYGETDEEGHERTNLISAHILKKETIDGIDYVEFIHDRLVLAIAEHREEMLKNAVERNEHYEKVIRSLPRKHLYYIHQNLIHEDGSLRQVDADEVRDAIDSFESLTQGENQIIRLCSNNQMELLNEEVAGIVYELREEYQKRRRKVTSLLGILGVVFSVFIACWMLWRNELYLKADSERNNALRNQSRYIAEKVKSIASDDSRLASLLAVETLPKDLNHPDRPYTKEAEWALREAVSYHGMILEGNKEYVNSVCCCPSGNYFASGSDDGEVFVWDELGNVVKKFKSAYSVLSVSFSPDGKNLVASSWNKIEICNVERDTLVYTSEIAAGGWINNVVYSPDGKSVFIACNDNTIKKLNLCGAVIGQLIGHTDKVTSIAFSPNGKQITTTSADHTIRIWDIESGQLIQTLDGHKDKVNDVCYSPDGKQLVSGSNDNHAVVWDAVKGIVIKDMEFDNSVLAVSYSHDGKHIAFASWDQIDIMNTEIMEIVNTINDGDENWVGDVEFNPNGNNLIYGSGTKVRIIGMKDAIGQHQFLNDCIAFNHQGIKSASYNSSGKRIITASSTQGIKFWDAISGEEIWSLNTSKNGTTTATFNLQGNLIVYNDDNRVILCDTMGNPIDTIVHNCRVDYASFRPLDKHDHIITITSQDSTIRIWCIAKQQFVDSIKGSFPYNYVCHSPNGKYSCYFNNNYFEYDSLVKRYGNTSNKLVDTMMAIFVNNYIDNVVNYSSPSGKIALNPNGDSFLIDYLDRCTIHSYKLPDLNDMETGLIIYEVYNFDKMDHNYFFNSVSYSPTGNHILLSTNDGLVKLYNNELSFIGNLHHASAVQSAIFSPDVNHIMSVQKEGTVTIWDFPPLQDLIDQTRERFKDRPLTSEEKKRYYLE